MAILSGNLPQTSGDGDLFITDGGIETTLIFREGLELPVFAAFYLLKTEQGTQALRKYYRTYADIARQYGTGFVLESATWRSSSDWGTQLGYSAGELDTANRKAIEMLHEVREQSVKEGGRKLVVSGCFGPRGDGYSPRSRMSVDQAREYHSRQAKLFREEGVDQVTAITMNYPEEAIGITQAAFAEKLPVVISFTVETDGRLPSNEFLCEAIERVDQATDRAPAYYMINCAHPYHFTESLMRGGAWVKRIGGLRCNASVRSHAELNEAPELDEGNPTEFGLQCSQLRQQFPHITVLGGCCGTDHRHVEEICRASTIMA